MSNFQNDSNSKFLNPVNNFDQIGLVTIPHLNDNDFFRYIIESITGIISGSDNISVQRVPELNFKGEGIIDKRVWIIKTLYPSIKRVEFSVNKAIIIIKSPFKIIQSLFLQRLKELEQKNSFNIERPDSFYDSIIQKDLELIKDFLIYWMDVTIPVHFIRYEDLIMDFVNTMKGVCQFLFNVENIKETIIESKIFTFLKFNKYFNLFIEELELEAKNMFKIFTIQQKNMILKYLKNELIKLGYLNENDFERVLKEKKNLDDKDINRLITYVNFNFQSETWIKKSNEMNLKNAIIVFDQKNREEEQFESQTNSMKRNFNYNDRDRILKLEF